MDKKLLILGSVFGLLAVVLGAFAAHGLESVLSNESMETFQTGVRYQMYHALFLLVVGSMTMVTPKLKKLIFILSLFGVLFFSGSVFGLATNELTAFDFKTIAFITPIGGLLLIISWLVLLINFVKTKFE